VKRADFLRLLLLAPLGARQVSAASPSPDLALQFLLRHQSDDGRGARKPTEPSAMGGRSLRMSFAASPASMTPRSRPRKGKPSPGSSPAAAMICSMHFPSTSLPPCWNPPPASPLWLRCNRWR
jgi:hypothetical protein